MPAGLSPQLEEALETFAAEKKARQKKVDALTAKAEAGGVKGMAARQELRILESGASAAPEALEGASHRCQPGFHGRGRRHRCQH